MVNTILDTELQQESGSQTLRNAAPQKQARASYAELAESRDQSATAPARANQAAQADATSPRVVFTFGVYVILLSAGLWATINVLRWFWHRLL